MLNYLPCPVFASVEETSSEDFAANCQPKTDLLKAAAILVVAGTGALTINHSWVAENQAPSTAVAIAELSHASAEVSEIVFFLLGAMTIVEIVDARQGFKLVTDNITTRKPRTLLWMVGFVTFFLSSILDNLTSTIVMVSLFRKLVPPSGYRNVELIASSIGVVSAIIGYLRLVAATMGMYDLSSFPQDSEFWQLEAYCAGTGGSVLVIGSAAGIAFMGMEKLQGRIDPALNHAQKQLTVPLKLVYGSKDGVFMPAISDD